MLAKVIGTFLFTFVSLAHAGPNSTFLNPPKKIFEANGSVKAIAFSPDSKFLTISKESRSRYGTFDIRILDTSTWTEVQKYERAYETSFSPLGNYLVLNSSDSFAQAAVYDTRTWKPIFSRSYLNPAWVVRFTPNEKYFLIRTEKDNYGYNQLQIIETATDFTRVVDKYLTDAGSVSPDSKYVVAEYAPRGSRVYDIANLKKQDIPLHTEELENLQFSSDGRFLFGRNYLGWINIFQMGTWTPVSSFYGGHDISFLSPDSNFLVTGEYINTRMTRVTDTRSWKTLYSNKTLMPHTRFSPDTGFSPDSHYLILESAFNNPDIFTVLDTTTWQEVYRGLSKSSPAFSPNGQFLVLSDKDQAKLLQVGSWKELLSFDEQKGYAEVKISSDGKLILFWNSDGPYRVFQIQ